MAPGLGNTHKLPAVRVEAPLTLPATLPTTKPPHVGAAPPTPGPLASDWFSQPDPRQPGPSQDSRKAFLLSETMGREEPPTHGRHFSCRRPWVGKSLHLPLDAAPLGLSLGIRESG